jgi:hypothetical protein
MFKRVGAAHVAAGDKEGAGAGNGRQGLNSIVAAADVSRILARPANDEIVPGDLTAVETVALCNECLFGFWVMRQNQIGLVARGRLKRLRRSLGQDMHGYSSLLCEGLQDFREQA